MGAQIAAEVTEAADSPESPASFRALAGQLVQESESDAEAALGEMEVEEMEPVSQSEPLRPNNQKPTLIKLDELFNFNTRDGALFSFYWNGGKANLRKEMEVYEMLGDAQAQDGAQADAGGQRSGGVAQGSEEHPMMVN